MSERPDLREQGINQPHRAVNNHLGRRHVQRASEGSGPVIRYIPGTPEYDQLMAERGLRYSTPSEDTT